MKTESAIISAALVGNPNVGKSTVFNALTGMRQHTGNWAGKTVGCAIGEFETEGFLVRLTDLPGIYSLDSHSPEEEEARANLESNPPDCVICVCDACCLERNLILALSLREICKNVIICVNLIDEAEKKQISVDFAKLSQLTGAAVVKTAARQNVGLDELRHTIVSCAQHSHEACGGDKCTFCPNRECDSCFSSGKEENFLCNDKADIDFGKNYSEYASYIASQCVSVVGDPTSRDRAIDKILCGKLTSAPAMLLLLACVFWLTLTGSSYISDALSAMLGRVYDWIYNAAFANLPESAASLLCDGIVSTVFRVVSVMLPPMAIFFPLFTLLEDLGYLPRVAFNLDRCFACCGSCGKQSLTMLMGLGCNAAGVTGCRIIDSPRERKIAVITNSLVPCNGRFPLIIAALGCLGLGSIQSAAAMLGMFVLSIAVTLVSSKVLSVTVLRGETSSFTLELPPYRAPQIGRVIIRSVFDRTVFVLGRAVSTAIPAGIIIWLCANIKIGDSSVYSHLVDFFEPIGKAAGMDGILMLSFIMALPAAELMLPLALAGAEMASGSTALYAEVSDIASAFAANGWSGSTVICIILFMMFHFPCATTLITVYRETKRAWITLLSALLPTAIGYTMCVAVNVVSQLI